MLNSQTKPDQTGNRELGLSLRNRRSSIRKVNKDRNATTLHHTYPLRLCPSPGFGV
ncbi:hypothetical protein GGR75_001659 [Xanthomonas campestris]|nr:hypothetical protein [Xanthomonas campestris]